MYFGRLGPEKNLPFLLLSFRGVAQAYSQVSLLLIGGGPEQENLQEMVQQMGMESRIRFTGIIPYEQLPGYLPMADAFVTASISEVHPLSVIEAMASGLPLVVSRTGGIDELVDEGQNGVTFASDDVMGLTAALHRLARQAAVARQLARAVNRLESLVKYDHKLGEIAALLNEASIQIDEAGSRLNHYLESLELDPSRLQAVERRLSTVHDLARAALEICARYADRRKAFGQKIREFEGVSFKSADSLTRLDAARALVRETARIIDSTGNSSYVRSMVSESKKFATDTAWAVVNDAMQVMGGIGYTNVYPKCLSPPTIP